VNFLVPNNNIEKLCNNIIGDFKSESPKFVDYWNNFYVSGVVSPIKKYILEKYRQRKKIQSEKDN
jgi:hypothetical protein